MTRSSAVSAGDWTDSLGEQNTGEIRAPLRLVLLGDMFMGGSLSMHWADTEFSPFAALREVARNDSVVLCTVETLFHRGPLRPRRSGHLYSPPESAVALERLGLSAASLAHNHAMDFGVRALTRTQELLESRGIATVGCDGAAKQVPGGTVISRNGWRIGFLAYTTSVYHVRSVVSGRFSAGCAPMEKRRMVADVQRLRAECDVLCVALHWGYEFLHVPTQEQRGIAAGLIEQGVDVIIGSHPHVVQGYEFIQGRPAFYSLGNLMFPEYETISGQVQEWARENNQSICAEVTVSTTDGHPTYAVDIVPLEFRFPNVTRLTGVDKEAFEGKLDSWNAALNDRNCELTRAMRTEVSKREKAWRRSLPARLIRRLVYEPLELLLGPHRMAVLRHRLGRRNL
ncbi:CapA family protein [Verrucomicrobiota bacterium]